MRFSNAEKPDILYKFKDPNTQARKNNMSLGMLISIERLAQTIKPYLRELLSPISSFIHLMHRQLFNQAKSFQYTLPEFGFDLNSVDPKNGEHLNKMRDIKLTEKL